MDGIELEDREFIAAIKEKREPNGSLAAVAALHARARQAGEDHRPAAQGARVGRACNCSAVMPAKAGIQYPGQSRFGATGSPAFAGDDTAYGATSLRLDAAGLQHLRPLRHFVGDQLGERLGRPGLGSAPKSSIRALSLGSRRPALISLLSLARSSGGMLRGALMPKNAIASKPGTVSRDRRHVRQRRDALRGCDAERTQPAFLDVIDLRIQVVEHDLTWPPASSAIVAGPAPR